MLEQQPGGLSKPVKLESPGQHQATTVPETMITVRPSTTPARSASLVRSLRRRTCATLHASSTLLQLAHQLQLFAHRRLQGIHVPVPLAQLHSKHRLLYTIEAAWAADCTHKALTACQQRAGPASWFAHSPAMSSSNSMGLARLGGSHRPAINVQPTTGPNSTRAGD